MLFEEKEISIDWKQSTRCIGNVKGRLARRVSFCVNKGSNRSVGKNCCFKESYTELVHSLIDYIPERFYTYIVNYILKLKAFKALLVYMRFYNVSLSGERKEKV